MSRVARSFCPRSSMPYVSPDAHPEASQTSNAELVADSMTWQQEATFGTTSSNVHKPPRGRNAGRRQYKRMDLQAPSPIIENNSSLSAQDVAVPASTPVPPVNGKETANNHKTGKQQHQSKNRGPTTNGNMSKPRASLPPHLRKRSTTKNVKLDSAVGLTSPEASPPSTDKVIKDEAATPASLSAAKRASVLPPSPPGTPKEPEPVQDDFFTTWGVSAVEVQPPPPPPLSKPRHGNSKWPRGPKPPKYTWIKSRDIKPVPVEEDDGGVMFESDSNGDPDYDIKKLLDWEGKWMPPPEDWANRKGFSDRHFEQVIETWINGHAEECTLPMDTDWKVGFDQETLKRNIPEDVKSGKVLVPRYWAEVKVEDMTLRDFWRDLPHHSPAAVDDDDITENSPWWDRFVENGANYVAPLDVPTAYVDMDDPENYVPTVGTKAAMASAAEKVEVLIATRIWKERRRLARQNRPVSPVDVTIIQQEEQRRLRPTVNMYIRPVQASDVQGITDIYNHYVLQTCFASEFEARSTSQIGARISDIIQAGLPYLVAVAKSNRNKGQGGYASEKIIGFINLDDYCDRASIFRYTFELEWFVRPGFTNQGVGKCLLDRVLTMTDMSYTARGGYEYVNKFEYLKNGSSRVVKTILFNVLHKHGEEIPRQKKVMEMFNFQRCGHIYNIGYKQDTAMDMSAFQYQTGEEIDARGVPRQD